MKSDGVCEAVWIESEWSGEPGARTRDDPEPETRAAEVYTHVLTSDRCLPESLRTKLA